MVSKLEIQEKEISEFQEHFLRKWGQVQNPSRENEFYSMRAKKKISYQSFAYIRPFQV